MSCKTFEAHEWGPMFALPDGTPGDPGSVLCRLCWTQVRSETMLELQARVAGQQQQLERIADALDKLVELERAQLALASLELDEEPEHTAEPPKAAWLVDTGSNAPFPGAWLCETRDCGRWNDEDVSTCRKCKVPR